MVTMLMIGRRKKKTMKMAKNNNRRRRRRTQNQSIGLKRRRRRPLTTRMVGVSFFFFILTLREIHCFFIESKAASHSHLLLPERRACVLLFPFGLINAHRRLKSNTDRFVLRFFLDRSVSLQSSKHPKIVTFEPWRKFKQFFEEIHSVVFSLFRFRTR